MVNNCTPLKKTTFFKAKVLPSTLVPDAFYIVENGDYGEIYLIDNHGAPKKIGNSLMITEVSSSINKDKNFVHDQSVASASWVVTHNLNKFPSVTVVNTAGDEVEGGVTHISKNLAIITFSAPFSGKAYLN